MELAANYRRRSRKALPSNSTAVPAGEPALGPPAYPHRISALPNPIAPIGHHWLDATHISFGVATAGLYGRTWKIEGSLFNGRERDENRYDLDLGALDSYSGRIWLSPSPRRTLISPIHCLQTRPLPSEPLVWDTCATWRALVVSCYGLVPASP